MGVRRLLRTLAVAAIALVALLVEAQQPAAQGPLDLGIGPGWPLAVVALPGGDLAIADQVLGGAAPRTRVRRLTKAGETIWVRELPGVDFAPRPVMSLLYGKLIALNAKTRSGAGAAAAREWTGLLKLDGAIAAYTALDSGPVNPRREVVRLLDGSVATISPEEAAGAKLKSRVIVRESRGAVRAELEMDVTLATELRTNAIAALADGGFVAAWTEQAAGGAPGETAPEIARFSSEGKRLWVTSISGLPARSAVSVVSILSDGRIAAAGSTHEPRTTANHSAWAAILDPDGRTISTALFGPTGLKAIISVIAPLKDGGLALGGCADLIMMSQLHPWIVLIGADGRVRREIKRLRLDGGNVTGLAATEDGGLAAVGISGGSCEAGTTADALATGPWLMLFPPSEIAAP